MLALWMIEPFVLVRPDGPAVPILISSPHSGTHYPASEERRLGIQRDDLATLSDGPVHELFLPAVQDGATLLYACWSRAWVDLNREPTELDDEAITGVPERYARRRSLRVRSGLGVVPTRLGERRIHQRRLDYGEVAGRIHAIHGPYHAAIEREADRLAAWPGGMLLLDCHSMPGGPSGAGAVPDVALGDRFGRTCAGWIVTRAEQIFRDAGFTVGRNQPFAGGWITEHHGRPERNRHALQIELRRALFLGEQGGGQACSRERLQAVARKLVRVVGAELAASADLLDAAE
jgi:N-formylglutamate amidohydrolase